MVKETLNRDARSLKDGSAAQNLRIRVINVLRCLTHGLRDKMPTHVAACFFFGFGKRGTSARSRLAIACFKRWSFSTSAIRT